MSDILEIVNLCKGFNNFSVKDISFTLPEGYIMGFIGANGAGKTTVIRLILNMLRKDSGEIRVFGLDHIRHEEAIKENLGVVSEQPYYFDSWNADTLEKALSAFYKTWNGRKYRDCLKNFGLRHDVKIRNLSKGMKLKLMIAVALSHETRLMILDEPTSGLDAVSRDEFMDILKGYVLSEERSVLLSTHITSDLEKIADYITILRNGELFFCGTAEELRDSYCVIKGEKGDLAGNQKERIIGFTERVTGFDGLLSLADIGGLSPRIMTETATLDDIILYTGKGGKDNG